MVGLKTRNPFQQRSAETEREIFTFDSWNKILPSVNTRGNPLKKLALSPGGGLLEVQASPAR